MQFNCRTVHFLISSLNLIFYLINICPICKAFETIRTQFNKNSYGSIKVDQRQQYKCLTKKLTQRPKIKSSTRKHNVTPTLYRDPQATYNLLQHWPAWPELALLGSCADTAAGLPMWQ